MTFSTYETAAGYTPKFGERCPSCKMVCGPMGPDHSTTCAVVAKLWAHENNRPSAIPARQTELGGDPQFQAWMAKMAAGLFATRVVTAIAPSALATPASPVTVPVTPTPVA